MTTNYLSAQIAGTDVSNRLQKIVTSRKATEGVGTFTLTLYNSDGALTASSFPVDSVFNLNLGTQVNNSTVYPFFNGYVDTVNLTQSQSQGCKNMQTCIVTGRDYGQDLQNKTVWGSDSNAIEQIVFNLLTYGGSPPTPAMITAHTGPGIAGYTEIAYTMPGTLSGTQCLFDSQGRTFIQANLKRMMGTVNWDCYVDNNKTFQMFPAGSVSSGIVLSEFTNQNIVGDIEYTPLDGNELRNVVIGFGGAVNDSWTDVSMAQFWETTNYYNSAIIDLLSGASFTITGTGPHVKTNCTFNTTTVYGGMTAGLTCSGCDQTSGGITVTINQTPTTPDPFQLVQAGASSLLIVNTLTNSNNPITWGLTFPKFFHWWLPFNWISSGNIQWSMFMHSPIGTAEGQPQPVIGAWYQTPQPVIWLTDTLGNQIAWVFGGQYRFNSWVTFSVPVGYNLFTEAQIYTASPSGNPPFAAVGHGSLIGGAWGIITNLVSGNCNEDKWIYTAWTNSGGTFPSASNTQYFIYTGSTETPGLYVSNGSTWTLKTPGVIGNQGFNWQVTNITFGFMGQSGSYNSLDWLLFDNLQLPSIVQVVSVADHSGLNSYGGGVVGVCPNCGRQFNPTTYKQRHLPLTRSNMIYQSDLTSYVETVANQRCNPTQHLVGGVWNGTYDASAPLSTLNLRCSGNAGLVGGAWMWYPGLTFSLNAASNYRFVELTNTIERNVENSGFSHVCDIKAVPKNWQLDMEQWTYNAHGDVGVVRQIHDRVTALENSYQILST